MGRIPLARAQARARRMGLIRDGESASASRSRPTTATPRRVATRAGFGFATARSRRCRRCSTAHAETLLGARFVARHGKHWPLLPKTLDVVELLSVQAHPPGNTEVYVILAAEPGATLRLGFKTDVDAKSFGDARRGRAAATNSGSRSSAARRSSDDALQSELKPWLADRVATPAALEPRWRPRARQTLARCRERAARVARRVLGRARPHERDSGRAGPGDLQRDAASVSRPRAAYRAPPRSTRSATPRGSRSSRSRSASPARRSAPGTTCGSRCATSTPTAAIAALNLERTRPEEFVVARTPGARTARRGRAPSTRPSTGSSTSRRRRPRQSTSPAAEPHSLHALAGAVSVYATDGALVGRLASGDSALVPIGVGAYRVVADAEPAEVLKVSVPPMPLEPTRSATLLIDLDALARNYARLRAAAAPAECAAVVKADAYGLGVAPVARRLLREGCTRFFVATAAEAARAARARAGRRHLRARRRARRRGRHARGRSCDAGAVLARADRALGGPRPRAAADRHRHGPARA